MQINANPEPVRTITITTITNNNSVSVGTSATRFLLQGAYNGRIVKNAVNSNSQWAKPTANGFLHHKELYSH